MAGQRVLLVENDLVVARAALRQLRHSGFETTWASDCEGARKLAAVAQTHYGAPAFDAGVFDIDLDDGNGVSLANELAQLNSVNYIVFHTGSAAQSNIAAARQLGPVYPKPDHFPHLVADLEQQLAAPDSDSDSDSGHARNQSGFPPIASARLQKAG
jgi:DNA-binding response OmpR family regulator